MRINSLKNDISIVNTILQEPNIMYNGVYLHDNYGAEAEAKEIFSKIENTPLSMHVIFGLGLGYLLQEFALNSKGIVILFEPNLEILASVLEIVDFTKELSKENVFIFSDWDEFKKMYINQYTYNSNTHIAFLPSYKKLFDSELIKFANNLNSVMGAAIINNNYIKHRMYPAIKMLCENIDLLVNEPPLGIYKDIYKDKTAVIVSAGPTLDRDIEILKKYRNNVIIFSVGQAAKTLVNNGIRPDFIGMIEASSQMSQIEGLDLSDVDLILEPITYRELHKAKFRNIISYPSHTSIPNLIWTEFANIDASLYVSSGTVSYMMLYSSKILGCKDIILVGQDLAYLDGKCYSKDACQTELKYDYDKETGKIFITAENFEVFKNSFIDKDLTEEQKTNLAKQRIDFINKNLYVVKGIKGNDLPSTTDYYSFIAQFSEFADKFKNVLNLYNASLEGAKINGFEDIPLEEILKSKSFVKREDLNIDFSYDLSSIIDIINHEMSVTDEIIKMLKTANTLVFNYDREFNNRKSVTENCIKYFKQLIVMYIDLSNIYSQKSRMFKYLQKIYALDLDYNLRISEETTTETISAVYSYLKIYMTSLLSNLIEIKTILKAKAGNLNEMLNSKS